MKTQKQFTDAITRNLRGVHFFSVGACPGCDECGLAGFDSLDSKEAQSIAAQADEGGFSNSGCDSCGSTLAGNLYPAHGVIAASIEAAQREDSTITHFDVCADCLQWHANGDLPDHLLGDGSKVSGYFCGTRGLEIEMTLAQAQSASHQGQCDEDVAALLRDPAIAAQLEKIGAESIRAALAEYGAWDDEELADDAQNSARAVWSAACDAREETESSR